MNVVTMDLQVQCKSACLCNLQIVLGSKGSKGERGYYGSTGTMQKSMFM